MLKIVVVDVNESFVSYAVFTESVGGSELDGSGLISGNLLETNSPVRSQLKDALGKLAPQPDNLILLLPRSIAQITSVEIPARNADMIDKMMEFEVPRHFPIPPDQLKVAHFTVGGSEGRYFVNLAGIRKADYDKWVGAVRESGLDPDAVSVSSIAWFDTETTPDGPGAGKRSVIEITPRGFSLSLVQGKRIMYSRYTRFRPPVDEKGFFYDAWSADTTTSEAASQISDECAKLELVSGLSGTSEYLGKTFISGGGSLQKGIAQALETKELFRGGTLTLPGGGDRTGFGHIARVHGEAGVEPSAGRFDFLPKSMRRSPYHMRRRKLLAGAAVLLLLLASWGGLAWTMQKSRLGNLNAELDRLKAAATSTEKMLVKAEEVQTALGSFIEFSRRRSISLSILEELSANIPKDTHLTDIEARGSSLIIAGISGKASALVPVLEGSPTFKEARMIGAVTSVGGGGEKFKIGMELE